MVLVLRPGIVPDELSSRLPMVPSKPANRFMDGGYEKGPLNGCWAGMVNEFRNHLTIFLAGTTELAATLPGAVAAQFADRLEDMEASAEFLQTLLIWMDASISGGTQVISDVGEVLRRAETLALTGLPARANIRLELRPAGVRNRGAAIECALAALITELGRVPSPWPAERPGMPGRFEVRTAVFPRPGAVAIILTSGGKQPPAGGWRVALAKTLLAQVSGTVEPLRDGTGFEVQFRSK